MPSKSPHPWPRAQEALRPLNADERDGLRTSLEHFGVRSPIVVLPDGRIVDGHHRWELAAELGIGCPHAEHGLAEEEAYRMAVELNTARRHLTKAERSQAIGRSLQTEPERTNADIAREHGVAENTVRNARARQESAGPQNCGHADRPRPHTKATPEEKCRARLLAEEGVSVAEIGRRLGRPPTTVGLWLKADPPSLPPDELERRRERHRRSQRAWRSMLDLNHQALQMWEGRGAIEHALTDEKDVHALVALAGATRRTQAMLAQLLKLMDARLGDEQRGRAEAMVRASGFEAPDVQ